MREIERGVEHDGEGKRRTSWGRKCEEDRGSESRVRLGDEERWE